MTYKNALELYLIELFKYYEDVKNSMNVLDDSGNPPVPPDPPKPPKH